ncbi:MAG TPA: 50S ribosomal protein L25 [Candidatus Moranbacteria bacterium]|nr:50S ribosomal protein L25 [Candidatus Moranbacteria bacterium]
MDKVKLSAKVRDVFGRRTKKGKKEGLVPAVVYGKKITPKSLWINALDFSRLLKKSGESTMIELEIDEKDKRNVIIYEIQRDPVTSKYIHADFFQVRMDEEIEKAVELSYIGEAPAVKEMGGVLVKSLDEITVKCLPADLPSEIEVDISVLKTFEDHITVKDLKISPKVKVDIDPETVVALVEEPRSEEELKSLEEKVEEDVTKVEGVIKEEKPAEGEAEGKEAEKK